MAEAAAGWRNRPRRPWHQQTAARAGRVSAVRCPCPHPLAEFPPPQIPQSSTTAPPPQLPLQSGTLPLKHTPSHLRPGRALTEGARCDGARWREGAAHTPANCSQAWRGRRWMGGGGGRGFSGALSSAPHVYVPALAHPTEVGPGEPAADTVAVLRLCSPGLWLPGRDGEVKN